MYSFYPTGDQSVHLIDGRRTPTGRLTGALSDYSATELGAKCINSLETIVDPQSVDEVILGSVIQAGQGQAPARQALIDAGWSPTIPAVTINKVCGSGIKAILQASESILGGANRTVVAGGMESMTNAPQLLEEFRTGRKMGNSTLKDSAVHDGLWCSVEGEHMGMAAERIGERYNLSRDALDQFALDSHENATRAQEKGHFEDERIVFDDIEEDEPVRTDTSMDQLGKLPTAFKDDGIVTPGNAPGLNDGASAIGVVDGSLAGNVSQVDTTFEIVGYSVVGDEPGNLFETPAAATEMLLEGRKWSLDDFDRIEINEAFAAQALANCHRLELDPNRVNQWGGAIALGHPIGMSGNRIVLTLMKQMRHHGDDLGLAAICMGGGNGIALAIRQVGA
jgi:acetyl-CoA C-acetyltransferase